jgi:RNA polymerase sigma factor (sigma-70 family)
MHPINEINGSRSIVALQQGDGRAWDCLVNSYAKRLTVIVHWRLPAPMCCRWSAEDIVQEILFRAFARRAMLTDAAGSGIWRWLLAIAFRVLAEVKRKEMTRMAEMRACDLGKEGSGSTRQVGMSGFAGTVARASEQAMRSESMRKLLGLLDQLRADDKDLLMMRFFEELSHEEMASRIGVSPEATRQRLSRLCTRLRGLMPALEACAS